MYKQFKDSMTDSVITNMIMQIKDVDGKTKRLWSHDMDMINHWFQQTVVGYDIIKG